MLGSNPAAPTKNTVESLNLFPRDSDTRFLRGDGRFKVSLRRCVVAQRMVTFDPDFNEASAALGAD